MPMHFRMSDALCEAHLMACTQKKDDIAEILLQALEVESEVYGGNKKQRHSELSLLGLAQTRHQKLEDDLRA